MSLQSIIVFLAVFVSPLAPACVWNSAIDPTFINMSTIPVCINAPSDTDRANTFAQFREAESAVRNSVRDLGERSALNFRIESDYCQDHDESPRQPKIRISLVGNSASYGQAFVDSSGFPTLAMNVSIPHLTHDSSELRNRQNIGAVTQHEILHLLGIQHDHRRGTQASIEKRENSSPSLVNIDEMNPSSIMNLSWEDIARYDRDDVMRGTLAVNDADIRCIEQVLQRGQTTSSPVTTGNSQQTQ